jgi:hypothetical protein
MQLTFAARDRLLQGEGKFDVFRNAMLVVGPACVVTRATAGLSFIAVGLQFASVVALTVSFGLASAPRFTS